MLMFAGALSTPATAVACSLINLASAFFLNGTYCSIGLAVIFENSPSAAFAHCLPSVLVSNIYLLISPSGFPSWRGSHEKAFSSFTPPRSMVICCGRLPAAVCQNVFLSPSKANAVLLPPAEALPAIAFQPS